MALALLLLVARVSADPESDSAPYRVDFRGAPEWFMRARLAQVSETAALKKSPPPTDRLLRWRAEQDLPALHDVLRAAGFHGARIDISLQTGPPRRVVFQINAGRRYRVGAIELDAAPLRTPSPQEVGLQSGMPARAGELLAAEESFLRRIRRQGHPFPRWIERAYRLDEDRHRIDIRWRVNPGPAARWGESAITGLVRVSESFVRNEFTFAPGDAYDPTELDGTRTRLLRSGLFSAVTLLPAAELDEQSRLPLALTLRERRPRTVSAGVYYTTDEGAGAQAGWEHRNLGGRAERLRLQGTYAEASRAVEARFTQPQFGWRRQDLLLTARAAEDEPDAYRSRNFRLSAQLGREISPVFLARAGAAFRLSEVDQLDAGENYVYLSVPVESDWNTSGDPLDPRRGHRIRARAEPFVDLESTAYAFTKLAATINRYQHLTRDRNWLLALRATAGVILDARTFNIPADERYYAGGGSSVRGYAYQSVGPLQDGDPVGGRSLLEVSCELRAQVSDTLGFAAFVDGGTAYASETPDFDEPFRWGTGVGLRYFTAVGPLRADIGFPLDRRSDIDRAYQFYLSLGQSF